MVYRRWGDPRLCGRWRGHIVAPPLYCFRAAVLVALDGDMSPTAACSRLLVFSSADAASRRPRCCAFISAGWQFIFLLLRSFGAAAGRVLRAGRVEESLDSLRHQSALFAFKVFQLVCRRLGGSNVFYGRGVYGAVGPEHAGDVRAALADRAQATRPHRSRRASHGAIHLALVGL